MSYRIRKIEYRIRKLGRLLRDYQENSETDLVYHINQVGQPNNLEVTGLGFNIVLNQGFTSIEDITVEELEYGQYKKIIIDTAIEGSTITFITGTSFTSFVGRVKLTLNK